MKIEKHIIRNVDSKGIVKSGGAIEVDGRIAMSSGEGCGMQGCHCSDGFWISITMPRTFTLERPEDGEVESIVAFFQDKDEMHQFFNSHRLKSNGVM